MNSVVKWLALSMISLTCLVVVYFKFFKKKETPDGGPCAYETTAYPARIIERIPLNADSTEFELSFEVRHGEYADTLYYSSEFGHYYHQPDSGFQALLGQSVVYEHHSITEGSCNPDFFVLTMNEY